MADVISGSQAYKAHYNNDKRKGSKVILDKDMILNNEKCENYK